MRTERDNFQHHCNQLDSTERERLNQPRKHLRLPPKRTFAFLLTIVLLMLCVVAPTVLSRSGLAAKLLSNSLSNHRFVVQVSSLEVGWGHPTKVSELSVKSVAGDQVLIGELTCDLSLFSYLTWDADRPVTIYARQASLTTTIEDGEVTLIREINRLGSDQKSSPEFIGNLKIEELNLMLHDRSTEQDWDINKANADASFMKDQYTLSLEGVLSNPHDQTGSFNLNLDFDTSQSNQTMEAKSPIPSWTVDLELDSFPVTFANLLTSHLIQDTIQIPEFCAGDATGRLTITHHTQGNSEVSFQDLQLRQYEVCNPSGQRWSQQLSETSGSLWFLADRLTAKQFSISTDFGNAVFDGEAPLVLSTTTPEHSLSDYISQINGTAVVDVDLPSFSQSMPDVLPLNSGVKLNSGRAHGTIESLRTADSNTLILHGLLDHSEATTKSGEIISFDPNEFEVTLKRGPEGFLIRDMKWESEFGFATGSGDLHQGKAEFSISLSKISQRLNQVFDLQQSSLQGTAQGSLEWTVSEEKEWSLDGSFSAKEVIIDIDNMPRFHQSQALGEAHATGYWSTAGIEKLNTLDIRYQCDDLSLHCDLSEPTIVSKSESELDLAWLIQGEVTSLQGLAEMYPETDIDAVEGRYKANGNAILSREHLIIPKCSINVSDALITIENICFRQPLIQIELKSGYSWKTQGWTIHDLTLSSHCMSARASGQKVENVVDYEIQWRVLIDRLLASISDDANWHATSSSRVQNASATRQFVAISETFLMRGDAEGSLIAKHEPDASQYEVDFTIKDLAIPYHRSGLEQNLGDPSRQAPSANPILDTARSGEGIWTEPQLRAIAILRTSDRDQSITIDQLDLSTNWIKTSLKGSINQRDQKETLKLSGQNEWNHSALSQQLASLLPFELKLHGTHSSPVSIDGVVTQNELASWTVTTDLGWDSASIAGIAIHSASIPLVASQETIRFLETNLQAGNGSLTIGGSIYQANNQTWIDLTPTSVAQKIDISPEMSSQWLRYITPVLADATQINGQLGIKVNEARININDSTQTRIRGQLEFDEVRLVAGPLMNQLIQTTERLRLAGQNVGPMANPADSSTLVKIPTQTVDFTVANRIAAHERLRLNIDRAQLLSTGQVDFDGNLGLTAMLPLDPRWLGQDLQRLSGQTLQLPIKGTLERPYLDASNLQSIITQLGVQVIQDNAESFIEEQINRSLNKLFGN